MGYKGDSKQPGINIYQIGLRIVLLYWQYICQLFKQMYADLYDCGIFTEFENNPSDQIVYLANL